MDIYNTINYMRQHHKTIFDIDIKVTYYVRVSTLKEEQESSVENQIAHFNKMISEHPNWTYVEGYVDRVRGESAVNRENFMRMIEDGKEGKFDLILTKEVSRFARNTIDSLTYTRELLRHGVGVFFQNDNICTVESDAEFRLTIMASIAQDEVRKLSERVKFGHKQSIQKGVVMGNSRIYGYEKNNGKLVIIEEEAKMIRFIFEQYASGRYALRAIVRQLYDMGYRTHNGKQIQHNTVKSIILNPKYKGYYCGNKVKIADYRTKEQVFLPEEDWLMYKDESGEIVPAIVSEEIWDKANALFKSRSMEIKQRGRGLKTTSVLSGKIVCTHHDNATFWRTSYSRVLHKDQSIYQWICREKKKGKASDCPTFAIYETELYDILSKFFISNIDDINAYTDTFMNVYQRVVGSHDMNIDIDKLLKDQERLERKKNALLELYTDGDITKADFKQQNNKINQKIYDNEIEIKSLKSKQISQKDINKKLTEVKEVIMQLMGDINNPHLSHDDVDVLVATFVDRIEVTSIDEKSMDINIILQNGKNQHGSFSRSSGLILQKMINSYKMQ